MNMVGQTVIAEDKHFDIIKLLGKGKGGYSYLASMNRELFVFKQIHYEPCDYFSFEANKLSSELRDYEMLRGIGVPVPKLILANNDEQYLIKEYISGNTLAEIVAEERINRRHITQLFHICKKLYAHRLNIDYFPTNFLEQNGTLYYVDFECSEYSDEWNFENWGIYFLANSKGMADFIKSGNSSALLENGKPIKRGFEDTVGQWLKLKDR